MTLVFVLGAVQSSAQAATGAIAGNIQDATGGILVSAKVVIQPTGMQTATDNQGAFRFSNLPSGEYSLTATYVGFKPFTTTVTVVAGQTQSVTADLQVASQADTVMVTAPRLQGEAEAVNVERMSTNIVQVEPAGVIKSLPNSNIAEAIGRLPSVSLERDEGEGKYVQIRGTEPDYTNLTINGVNVPSVEVTVRNVKMDSIPANGIERIEAYKTLSADMDADGVGGTINLVTPTAQDKPTYELGGTAGYNPLQTGYWRGGFDGTYGQRFGPGKKFGFLLGSTWDRTNRGINDLEPSQAIWTFADGTNIAYVNGEDMRSYDYYRTRYGFDIGVDDKISKSTTAYVKGLFADFHDYGEAWVYTPSAGGVTPASESQISGSQINFDDTGNWQYRQYIRRPDQQVFSFLTGVTQTFTKNVIDWGFAVSRGHNIGGQDFPTTYFTGPQHVTFSESLTDPYRPKFTATDGTNGFDASQYTVNESDTGSYHATQLNIQGSASLAHSFTIDGHPDTFSFGAKIRNSASSQFENDTHLAFTGTNPFTLATVVGSYTNPSYYDKTFAINGQAFGPASSYDKILRAVASNSSAFAEDIVGDSTIYAQTFFNANERISAGYLEDVLFFNHARIEGGVRFDAGSTHFLAYTMDVTGTSPCYKDPSQTCPFSVTPNRQDASYFNALPSVSFQYQLPQNSDIRLVYSRGLARPDIGNLVPVTVIDPNQTPYPTVSTGNPTLVPTKSDNFDVLGEHYFQSLGIVQFGYFFKELHDPIYPVANLVPNYNGTGKTYQEAYYINGPNGHVQGVEMQWEQRFSFLPGFLGGFGLNANYSHTASQATFPSGFDGDRTDHPYLPRTSPNDYNINMTYDRYRFSGAFAVSHNDESIAAYGWNATTGPSNDPILGLKGPLGDNYFYPHTQIDAQGSFRLYKGWRAVVSGLDLNNEVFGFYNGSGIYPVQREYYRPTVSFGLRWQLSSE